jgi:hypothetical protein
VTGYQPKTQRERARFAVKAGVATWIASAVFLPLTWAVRDAVSAVLR